MERLSTFSGNCFTWQASDIFNALVVAFYVAKEMTGDAAPCCKTIDDRFPGEF